MPESEPDFDIKDIWGEVEGVLNGTLNTRPAVNPIEQIQLNADNEKDLEGRVRKQYADQFLVAHFETVVKRGFRNPRFEVQDLKTAFLLWRQEKSARENNLSNKELIDGMDLELLDEASNYNLEYWSRKSGSELIGSEGQLHARQQADFWSPISDVTGAALE